MAMRRQRTDTGIERRNGRYPIQPEHQLPSYSIEENELGRPQTPLRERMELLRIPYSPVHHRNPVVDITTGTAQHGELTIRCQGRACRVYPIRTISRGGTPALVRITIELEPDPADPVRQKAETHWLTALPKGPGAPAVIREPGTLHSVDTQLTLRVTEAQAYRKMTPRRDNPPITVFITLRETIPSCLRRHREILALSMAMSAAIILITTTLAALVS